MIKFVNRLTGTFMYVDESRKDEYLAAGHKIATGTIKVPAKRPVKKEKKK